MTNLLTPGAQIYLLEDTTPETKQTFLVCGQRKGNSLEVEFWVFLEEKAGAPFPERVTVRRPDSTYTMKALLLAGFELSNESTLYGVLSRVNAGVGEMEYSALDLWSSACALPAKAQTA